MKLTVSEPLPLPAEEVFHLLRDDMPRLVPYLHDDMPRLVPYLHDIARIEVTDRVDEGDTVRLVNRRFAPQVESAISGQLTPNMRDLAASIRAYAAAR